MYWKIEALARLCGCTRSSESLLLSNCNVTYRSEVANIYQQIRIYTKVNGNYMSINHTDIEAMSCACTDPEGGGGSRPTLKIHKI